MLVDVIMFYLDKLPYQEKEVEYLRNNNGPGNILESYFFGLITIHSDITDKTHLEDIWPL
jgi:hypothetical protein